MSDETTQSEFQKIADEPVETLGDAAILDELPAVPDGFHVNSDASANWVVRHINEARARYERAKDWAAKEMARSEREEAFFLSRYGAELETYARGRLALKGTRAGKSVSLPHGVLAFRTAPAHLVVDDEKACAEWAKSAVPLAVEVVVTEKLDKRMVAEAWKNHGLQPEGCHVEEATERFSVK